MPTLQFKGKTFVQNHHLAVKYHQLVPKKELSLTDKISLHDNLIIQGDNLKALKALLPTYAGKIKCIYIDPPYNTGNEGWVYNDNVNSPMIKEWLGKTVDKDDLTKHDKWLCMMVPRLKLLKELMRSDGAIFISIDDNELANLTAICNEIFGESNFIATLPRITKKAGKTTGSIAKNNDYVLVYKGYDNLELETNAVDLDDYDEEDEFVEERGKYKLSQTLDYGSIQYSGSLDYEIKLGNDIFRPGSVSKKEMLERIERNPKSDFCWRWSKDLFDFGLKNGFVVVKESKNGKRIYTKTYANATIKKNGNGYFVDIVERTKKVTTLEFIDNQYSNDNSRKEIESLFGNKEFEYSKPSSLVKKIAFLATDKDSIILDSFAGSGTTAHAVLDLNNEDGGNRKFILVEQEDYANTITAERVRLAIKGVKSAKNGNLKTGLGGTFSYFELGPTIEMESILQGKNLPSYEEFARYIFYTATGEEFNEKKINEKTGFIGETKNYELYMFYKPDVEWLKRNALTLDGVKAMPKFKGKQRLVFAPAKYIDDYTCLENRIDFCQLPYEIYRIQK
jgi:adenine-specific DNA-methyltransferase